MFLNEPVSLARKQGRTRLAMAVFAAAVTILCGSADAHSTLKSTKPASGSILTASPEQIIIEFNEPASLTAVVAAGADGSERKLKFEPASSATLFSVSAPQLTTGRTEVRWTALSKDGHPIKGTIIIIVKPAVATDTPTQKPVRAHGDAREFRNTGRLMAAARLIACSLA